MNTEALTSTNSKEVQPVKSIVKSIDLNAKPIGKKDAERASCGNGVCEVSWKPFDKSIEPQHASQQIG
jgi:hypothetical protein